MSNFEVTAENMENRFLSNPEEVSLLVGLKINTDNLIEKTHDEINRVRLISF